jgi:hypothetical protein
MKNLSLVVCLFFVSLTLYSQDLQPVKLRYKDSIELSSVWIRYKNALANRDIHLLHNLSLKIVDCDIFQTPDPIHPQNPNISIDTFLHEFYAALPTMKLWRVMKTKKYHMEVERALYSNTTDVTFQKNKSLMIYSIWYVTFEPNEIAKGHEGESEAFQFVKIKGKFKFYGLTSIP